MSGGQDQMVPRADHGIYITNISGQAPWEPAKLINTSVDAYLGTEDGLWHDAPESTGSSTPVNADAVLGQLDDTIINEWHAEAESGGYHVGLTPEDSHAHFGLGTDDGTVAMADLSGVALASIQAISHQLKAKDAVIQSLEGRVTHLETMLESLLANPQLNDVMRPGLAVTQSPAGQRFQVRALQVEASPCP
jgi:hypothetical protein